MVRDNELSFGDFEFQNLSKAQVNLDLKFIATIFRIFRKNKKNIDFFEEKFMLAIYLQMCVFQVCTKKF